MTLDNGLTPEQINLLTRSLAHKGIQCAGARRIQPRTDRSEAVLSFAQQRLWFIESLYPDTAHYNIPRAYQVSGPLDITIMQACLNEIIRRHEILRTTFALRDDEPIQRIARDLTVEVPVHDLRDASSEVLQQLIEKHVAQEACRPFSLEQGPLVRLSVLQCPGHTFVLMLTLHHIVTDGWSMGILINELATLYEALVANKSSALVELPVQYADFAAWEQAQHNNAKLEQSLRYWCHKLRDLPPPLALPFDRDAPVKRSHAGDNVWLQLPSVMLKQLQELGGHNKATLFMVGLAACNALLRKHTGLNDIIVGTPVANRHQEELEPLIGFFVNTLVLRTDVGGDPVFSELLARVRDTALAAYSHQQVPFERLVDKLGLARQGSEMPLVQVMFVLQNAPETSLDIPGLDIKALSTAAPTTKFDLVLELTENEHGLLVSMQYSTELFERETVQHMLEDYCLFLDLITAEPQLRLSALWPRADERRLQLQAEAAPSIPALTLSEAEREHLLHGLNASSRAHASDICIHELISMVSAQQPELPAVEHDGQVMSYAELERDANRLAHYLIRQGLVPGTLVGVCSQRTPAMLVSVLAILKAGGAYVPLDSTYPPARIAYMLDDTGMQMVLTQRMFSDLLPSVEHAVYLDELEMALRRCPDTVPEVAVAAEHVAYVIYTSGSTGAPKGVQIRHRNTVALLEWAGHAFSAQELGRVLACTSLSFDLSVFEMFAPLSRGGTVVLVENALSLREQSVDVSLINTVPTAARALLEDDAIPAGVRTINLAGEALQAGLVNDLLALASVARVCNLYGPTEDTTYSTWSSYDAPVEGVVKIGRPIDNTRCYVLDEQGELLPEGAVGELYLGGAGVALGYLGRPEMTAERFVADDFAEGEAGRLYRTGDLVRWLEGGELAFIGRLDDQVKIRGFRIEMGEIEHCLSQMSGVISAAVHAHADAMGMLRLVGYVTLDDQAQTRPVDTVVADLRTGMQALLPDYMLPATYLVMEALPLTANGKLNRRALPMPELNSSDSEYVGPDGAAEELIAELWCDLLNLQRVSVHDNLLHLGGDSILAARIIARLTRIFQIEVSPARFFERPTVRGLTLSLAQLGDGEDALDDIAMLYQLILSLPESEVTAMLAQQANE